MNSFNAYSRSFPFPYRNHVEKKENEGVMLRGLIFFSSPALPSGLEVFLEHWTHISNYYCGSADILKNRFSLDSNLLYHVKALTNKLKEEASPPLDSAAVYGPCFEFLLKEKILAILVDFAELRVRGGGVCF